MSLFYSSSFFSVNSAYQNQLKISDWMGFWDWFIFVLVLGLTFLAVIVGHRMHKRRQIQQESSETHILEFILMGRQLTLPFFVLTLVSTWYGGIFGVTEISFKYGIYNFVTQGAFWYLSYLIMAFILVPKIRSFEAVTLPDLVGRMFGPQSAKLSAIFNFFNIVPVSYAISAGLLLQLLFGWSLDLGIFAGVGIVLAYSSWGGLRAIVFSDAVQCVCMCLGVLVVVVFSLGTFGGWAFLQSHLPDSHFSPLGGHSISATLVWGFIAMVTLVDPSFYQRCFAARSTATARNGILISTFIWFCFDCCTTLGGMYARAVIPEADSHLAYVTFAMQILPEGFRGLFVAGILATILSTLDSFYFIAANTLSYDLLPLRHRSKKFLRYLSVWVSGLITALLAVQFDGNIRLVWKTFGSYMAACLLVPILYGYFFPNRIRDRDFVWASLAGVVATTWWRLSPPSGFWADWDELYAGLFATSLVFTSISIARWLRTTTSKVLK